MPTNKPKPNNYCANTPITYKTSTRANMPTSLT